jgi:hypothetical protein
MCAKPHEFFDHTGKKGSMALTPDEIRAILETASYWNVVGVGTVEDGLGPVGVVAQMRGARFINKYGDGILYPATPKDWETRDGAEKDITAACGFPSPTHYHMTILNEGTDILKRLLCKGKV